MSGPDAPAPLPHAGGGRLLDLSRIVSRLGRGPMTGIDRVELTYLQTLLAGDRPLHALVRTAPGYCLLDRDGTAQLAALAAAAPHIEALEAEIDAAGKPITVEAVRKAYAKGDLGDEIVTGAATMARREPVVTALSLLTGVAPGTIDMVLDAQSGRGITALCWKAGLSMRTALSIQAHIAHVPQANLVLPREGIDYPLAESEILWHLQYFGIETGEPQVKL